MKEQLNDPRHPVLGAEHATVEANRCIYCYDAPCIKACPTSIDIPQFIARIGNGDLLGSAQSILASNILGYSCATVCPVEVLCEGACVYNKLEDPPIRIGDLQKFATEHFYSDERNIQSLQQATKQSVRVAAIGGGPASLSFAAYIVLNGGEATIYEKDDHPGGLNSYGVAPYKLSFSESLAEVELIKKLGAQIKTGVEIGKDLTVQSLLDDHDALFIGTGLGADKAPCPIPEAKGISGALPLIAKLKQDDLSPIKGVQTAIILGGGNTALDVAQELALCRVPSVILCYRRGEKDMSGYSHELKYTKSYGVRFLEQHSPVEIHTKDGSFDRVTFDTPQGQIDLAGDLLVFATGQQRHPLKELFPKLKLSDDGIVNVNQQQKTNIAKVYAGGDCANGGKEVVNAVAEGRQAALDVLQSNNLNIYYGKFSN